MAYLVLLFLDLSSIPTAHGDDALYRQAMADHHLKGAITLNGSGAECSQIAGIRTPDGAVTAGALFSRIAWVKGQATFQINASDAIYCSSYRKVGASYRLLQEVRLPR